MKDFLVSPGWSRCQWLLFLPFLGLFILVLIFGLYEGMSLTDWILWLTGVVLLIYTVETNGLRREMVRQNEIAIQPVVIATMEERSSGTVPAPRFRQQLILRNVGRGTALFLKVQDLTLTDPAGDRVRFVARFAPISCLEPQQEKVVEVAECRAIDTDVPSGYLDPIARLVQPYALEDYDVVIEYQDTNGAGRETHMRMGKGGITLLRHTRMGSPISRQVK